MRHPFDDVLLARSGRVVLQPANGSTPEWMLCALDIELAALGFVLSHRLRAAIGRLGPAGVADVHSWSVEALGRSLGAGVKHEPLFRRFPEDVPSDTADLWWKKFVGFYLQTKDQPCLWCDGRGNTHVLSPCGHAVCDACFDGSNYSACPVCERAVDRSSPFFQLRSPSPLDRLRKKATANPVPLRRLVLAGDRDVEARTLFADLVARPQVMSPADVEALNTIVVSYGRTVIPWLPPAIPVRENVAHVFGALLRTGPATDVLAAAQPWLKTATDLLRVLAAFSGADPSLQPVPKRVPADHESLARWWGAPRRIAAEGIQGLPKAQRDLIARYPPARAWALETEIAVRRFRMARMNRSTRRAVLGWLDALPESSLLEDVSRHKAAWVGVGEQLHPGEYADRYPRAARAFRVVRGEEHWAGFASTAETLRGTAALAEHLATRPGELWRRADDALRDAADPAPLLDALLRTMHAATTPLLITMRSHLARRGAPWPVRVFFPKGAQFLAPSSPDDRPPLPDTVRTVLLAAVDDELLARFKRLPHFDRAVLDAGLATVVVPFNERTAARAAVALPRGSSIALPPGERLRLFLHWCQPEGSAEDTDIDLSVAFYDEAWAPSGVCSYYKLQLGDVAASSGDLRNAPYPDGASEFVDVDRAAALRAGHRYAVMVVNAYAGLSFSSLERAFAGVMGRDDDGGPAFDPAAVALRFDVTGPHGTYVPLVVDLKDERIWWLDVSHAGQIALNNVQTANAAITRFSPALLAYFGHGVRPSMFELGALHAVARADEIWVRGNRMRRFARREGESLSERLRRVLADEADGEGQVPDLDHAALAILLHGDIEMPEGSVAWALFRERLGVDVSPSDLLVTPG